MVGHVSRLDVTRKRKRDCIERTHHHGSSVPDPVLSSMINKHWPRHQLQMRLHLVPNRVVPLSQPRPRRRAARGSRVLRRRRGKVSSLLLRHIFPIDNVLAIDNVDRRGRVQALQLLGRGGCGGGTDGEGRGTSVGPGRLGLGFERGRTGDRLLGTAAPDDGTNGRKRWVSPMILSSPVKQDLLASRPDPVRARPLSSFSARPADLVLLTSAVLTPR